MCDHLYVVGGTIMWMGWIPHYSCSRCIHTYNAVRSQIIVERKVASGAYHSKRRDAA